MIFRGIAFTKDELKDLALSTLALGFIFSLSSFSLPYFIILTIVLALSFIPHELAHKMVAMRYGHYARYVMWKEGLFFALLLAIITGGNFIFAAPGAVMISKLRFGTSRENAMISVAGPTTNLLVALTSYLIYQIHPLSLLYILMRINAFLAFFNLLPIPPLDGSKIIWYSIPLWAALISLAGILVWGL